MVVISLTFSICSCTFKTSREEKLEQENAALIKEIAQLRSDNDALKETLAYERSRLAVHKFKCPVPMQYAHLISSGQGFRNDVKINSGGVAQGSYHNGIDIPLPYKTPIYASKDGYVIICYPGRFNGAPGYFRGHKIYGACLLIQHYDNTQSFYAHLSRTDVKDGDFVKQGDQIALSGGTGQAAGQSSGNHLHFATYMNIADLMEN